MTFFFKFNLKRHMHKMCIGHALYILFIIIIIIIIKDEVLLTVGCPIFSPFYIDSQISVHRKFKKIDQLIFRNAK